MSALKTNECILKLNETLMFLGLKGDKDNLPWKKIIDADARYLHILGAALLADVIFHFGFRIRE